MTLSLPRSRIDPHFPTEGAEATAWTYTWTDDTLTITANTPEPSARVLRLTRS